MRSTCCPSFVLWCLASLFFHSQVFANDNDHPNVLVIMVDDMGYGDPGCFNPDSKIETPHINRLAAEGMRFTDAHAAGPLCHVSRYGLLTGRYPFRTSFKGLRNRPIIDEGQETIASLLKNAGYSTAMVGKWHLGFKTESDQVTVQGGPVDRGFDAFFGIHASTDIPPYYYIKNDQVVERPTNQIEAGVPVEPWTPIQGKFWRAGGIAPDLQLEKVTPRFTQEAIGVVERHVEKGTDQPLFLYLAYPSPHTPWLPTDEFEGKSKAGLYGDFATMVDDEIGKVLEAYQKAGLLDDTLILFTSDNGPVWYDKDRKRFEHDSVGGLRGMKADAWEGGHRMPFIVRWPKAVKPGTTANQTISFADVFATLAELTGQKVEPDAGPDSFSFLRVLKDSQHLHQRPPIVLAAGGQTKMIRSGNWKLITKLGSGGFSKPSRVEPKPGEPVGQLYDMATDLSETNNVYLEHPKVVARLSAELKMVEEGDYSKLRNHQQPNTRATQKRKPNIILIMADDQGWGQTSYNGHPRLETPNLDAMASNGLCFNRFYAAAPVCSPTRAAVLTGRTNCRTGVQSHGYALRLQEKTIAEALQRSGYATGHFGKWHLNGMRGPGVPMLADDPYRPSEFGFDTWFSVTNFFDMDPVLSRDGRFEECAGDSSEVIVDEALQFIEQQNQNGRSSFSVIWFGTPHNPFRASDNDTKPFMDLDEKSRTQLGELVAMDRSIGTLRRRLVELGIAENTIVWFTSDNGGLPGMKPKTTGGLRGFKGSLYEGGLRVPAIIEWPTGVRPRKTSFPSVSMDIFPTIAELVGLSKDVMIEPQDGMSLVPLFSDELKYRENPIPFSCFGNHAIIDNDLKLLFRGARNKPKAYELYDLKADPTESNNLVQSNPEDFQRLQAMMTSLEESIESSVRGLDYPEKAVIPETPEPRFWTEVEQYKPYFDSWRNRPEYRSRLTPKKKKTPTD